MEAFRYVYGARRIIFESGADRGRDTCSLRFFTGEKDVGHRRFFDRIPRSVFFAPYGDLFDGQKTAR